MSCDELLKSCVSKERSGITLVNGPRFGSLEFCIIAVKYH